MKSKLSTNWQDTLYIKVWVFWEGHTIWKNLRRTFDKSVVFCVRNSVLVKKSTKIFLKMWTSRIIQTLKRKQYTYIYLWLSGLICQLHLFDPVCVNVTIIRNAIWEMIYPHYAIDNFFHVIYWVHQGVRTCNTFFPKLIWRDQKIIWRNCR